MAHIDAVWALDQVRALYRKKIVWQPKHWKHIHDAIEQLGGDFRSSWTVFLKDRTPFYRGHSPGKFIIDTQRFQAVAEPEEMKPLIDQTTKEDVEMLRAAVKRNRLLQKAETERRRNAHQERLDRIRDSIVSSPKTDHQIHRDALEELKGKLK